MQFLIHEYRRVGCSYRIIPKDLTTARGFAFYNSSIFEVLIVTKIFDGG